MSFRQAWSALFNSPRKPRATRRLTLEALEDRLVLATLTVGPDAGEFATISAAIAASANGDTINVDPGIYIEQLLVNKALTITATGGAPATTVRIPSVPAVSANTSTVNLVEIANGVIATINNFSLRGPGTGPGVGNGGSVDIGVFVGGNSNLTLNGCVVSDIHPQPFNGDDTTGFGIAVGSDTETGQATIQNSTVSSYQKAGIVVSGAASRATVSNSTVTGMGDTATVAQIGIQVGNGAIATLTNNLVSGNLFGGANSGPNVFTATQAVGILLNGAGTGTTLTGNTVVSNDAGVYSFVTGTATLTNNRLQGNRYEGLAIDQGTTNASGNIITGGAVGIALIAFSGASGATANSILSLTGNTIQNAGIGLSILDENTTDAIVPALTTANNQIINNTRGIVNSTNTAIMALNNFYGSLAGPINTANPQGRGNSVEGNVIFGPWAASTMFQTFVANASQVPSFLYVAALYTELLNRPFDDAGLAGWTGLLLGGQPRSRVSLGIRTSTEYYFNEVAGGGGQIGFYQQFLGRGFDETGRAAHTAFLLGGGTENQDISSFLLSPEYQNAHVSNAEFLNGVRGLYPALLGRAADPTGLAAFTLQLQQGVSRATVITQFLFSEEFAFNLVRDAFTDFLGAATVNPNDPGVQFWVNMYLSSQNSPTGDPGQRGVEAGILASDEFFARSQMASIYPT